MVLSAGAEAVCGVNVVVVVSLLSSHCAAAVAYPPNLLIYAHSNLQSAHLERLLTHNLKNTQTIKSTTTTTMYVSVVCAKERHYKNQPIDAFTCK